MKWLSQNKTVLLISFGFLLVTLFLWLDEVLDLPAVLFHAPRTPINITESLFETVVIFVLGALIIGAIHFMEKNVQTLKQEKSKIISIISHDLKNTFTSLIGHTKILNNPPNQLSPDDYQHLSTAIYAASKKTFTLMENLLHWSKINSEILTLHPIPFDLAGVIQNNLNLVHHQAQAKKITLTSYVEPQLVITADKNMIDSVIYNVLHNAIKFTPDEGTISIQVLEEKNQVKILFSDSGIGFPKNILEHIGSLGPGNTRPGTRGEKGSGLGLFICREFIQRNQGKFIIANQPGKGSTITIILPKK